MLAREKLPTARRGLALALRAIVVFGSMGAGACHTKPGTLPVDSPVYAYKAPEAEDDDDSDSNEGSDTGSAAASTGSGAKKE